MSDVDATYLDRAEAAVTKLYDENNQLRAEVAALRAALAQFVDGDPSVWARNRAALADQGKGKP